MVIEANPRVRASYATTARRLDRQSPAYRLYEKAKRLGIWNPSDIDFSQDKADWQKIDDDHRGWILSQTSHFIAGEEAVAIDLLPLVNVIAQEGRLEEEMFLTTFLFEEAKHIDLFNRFLDEVVGPIDDISHYHGPGYSEIFYNLLPEALQALNHDPSPQAQVRASVIYNMIVEGIMAEVGYFHWNEMLHGGEIMPGLYKGLELIKQDESRHIAYGTFLLSRLIAADDSLWPVVEATFAELRPHIINDENPPENDPGHDMKLSLYDKRLTRLHRARHEPLERIYRMAYGGVAENGRG